MIPHFSEYNLGSPPINWYRINSMERNCCYMHKLVAHKRNNIKPFLLLRLGVHVHVNQEHQYHTINWFQALDDKHAVIYMGILPNFDITGFASMCCLKFKHHVAGLNCSSGRWWNYKRTGGWSHRNKLSHCFWLNSYIFLDLLHYIVLS